jgi:hypothetical protein
MKIAAVLLMLFGTQFSLASNNSSPADCMRAVTQALSLSSGQKLEAKAEKCELHVSFDQSQYSQMRIEFFVLEDLQTDPQKIQEGIPDYQMVSWLDSQMDDQVNGLNEYDISRCDVSADQIQLKYVRKQTFGWHSKFRSSVQISLKNGHISAAQVQGDSSAIQSCVF